MLTEPQKKRISDRALGDSISQAMNIHDQVAAIRKQVVALSEAAKVPLVPELTSLEKVVSDKKAKLPIQLKVKATRSVLADYDDRK